MNRKDYRWTLADRLMAQLQHAIAFVFFFCWRSNESSKPEPGSLVFMRKPFYFILFFVAVAGIQWSSGKPG